MKILNVSPVSHSPLGCLTGLQRFRKETACREKKGKAAELRYRRWTANGDPKLITPTTTWSRPPAGLQKRRFYDSPKDSLCCHELRQKKILLSVAWVNRQWQVYSLLEGPKPRNETNGTRIHLPELYLAPALSKKPSRNDSEIETLPTGFPHAQSYLLDNRSFGLLGRAVKASYLLFWFNKQTNKPKNLHWILEILIA